MNKSVLITDLDNTLFDWVDIWYQSFSSMLEAVVEQTKIDQELLKTEIRAVHQIHGTSEYAFLLEEVPSLQKYADGRPITTVFADAIDSFRQARQEALVLYPGVLQTLTLLKSRGCMVIGYTESMAFYSAYRVRKLELDGLIDFLFSPEDHDLPANISREDIRKYPAEHYAFKKTHHRHTPKGELKPNPHILQEIISSVHTPADKCVYVGDSLHKDIAMAKDAGIDHAWAKYGKAQDRPEYQLLREVTHWTDTDVQREKEIHERNMVPDHTLQNGFDEILDIYDFDGTPA